ncbi:MAG: hypothetical protein FJ040_04675 [Chloroflexi bacterium]|nr:hypothetical protein [Chloroflexota bacterium]
MQRTARHIIGILTLLIGISFALVIWLSLPPEDMWSRRWLVVIIPGLGCIGLLIAWWSAWRDVLFGIAVTYFVAPLIAARVESCFLPIPNMVPCFADVVDVRNISNALGHPLYYPGLIVLHCIGVIVTWWYVSTKGASDASTHSSTT